MKKRGILRENQSLLSSLTGPFWPGSLRGRYALAVSILIGASLAASGTVIAHFLQLPQDGFRSTVSEQMLGDYGWIQSASFFAAGAVLIFFVAALYLNVRRGPGLAVGVALLSIAGAAFFVVALFLPHVGPGSRTVENLIHIDAARTAGLLFPTGCLLLLPSLRKDLRWRSTVVYTVLTGGVLLGLALLAGVGPRQWYQPWSGLHERLMLFIGFLWIQVMTYQILVIARRSVPGLTRKRAFSAEVESTC